MNLQQIMDKGVKHLLTQGRKSLDPETQHCLYRGPEGLQCGAAPFISDEHYKPEMERKGVHWASVTAAIRLSNPDITDHGIGLIGLIQGVHDDFPVSMWKQELANIARSYGLEMNIPYSACI